MAAERWWRADVLARKASALRARDAIRGATRNFFASQGFSEVDTPTLQVSPGLEPHLRAFATSLEESDGVRPLFLHTSPEFAMKKLLAAGMPKIFQLAHAFRNGERSATHHPEFTMLEWYRAGADYRALMADCEGLLHAAAAASGVTRLTWRGKDCDPAAPWQRLSVAEAFHRYAGLDILATASDPRQPDRTRHAAAAAGIGIVPHDGDDWEDLFFRIFLERIEPLLGSPAPTLLTDYPIALAALARAKPGDPRIAERVELYVAGLELANGFSELTDAAEQRARFARDRAKQTEAGVAPYPVDEDFLAALESLPDSAGMALGFDRLVMLATGARSIDDVLWAPLD